MNITILGGGSWAIALAVMLRGKNHAVRMWEFNPKDADMLRSRREHPQKLPGIKIPAEVVISSDIRDAMDRGRIRALRGAVADHEGHLQNPCGRARQEID